MSTALLAIFSDATFELPPGLEPNSRVNSAVFRAPAHVVQRAIIGLELVSSAEAFR